MSDEIPSILSHVSVGVNDFEAAVAFYDRVLEPLGIVTIMEHPDARAYGKTVPEFGVQKPFDGKAASVGNGAYFAFLATSKEQVDAFHAAGLAAGGSCDGPPGPRPLYGAPYYGAFLRDLEGNKIEATFWDTVLASTQDLAG